MVKKLLALSPAALKRAILEAKQQDSGVESKKKKKRFRGDKVEGTEAITKNSGIQKKQ